MSDVLDPAALEQLNEVTGGDPEFMAELVTTFLDDAPTLIAQMRADSQNAAEVRRLSHGLKSNGVDFGAVHFAALCKDLEQKAKAGDLSDADERITAIEAEFVRVKAALEDYISG